MKNTYIFLRHALTTIDKSQPAEKWVISEAGIEEICNVVSSGEFDDVDVIISSSEKKAIQTAFYLSERIEKDINLNPNLKELERGRSLLSHKKIMRQESGEFSIPQQNVVLDGKLQREH